ncbi:MAG: strawberry notch C-terminal domain-containing protein, partial [Opitutaceae bacterium]
AHRASVIGDFQADRKHALVLQIGAGGVGVSLHDVRGERPRHSLLSPPESARDLIQALGRNRRVGQRSPAFRTILTLAGSVEERVKAAVERKAAQNETINDGDLSCGA